MVKIRYAPLDIHCILCTCDSSTAVFLIHVSLPSWRIGLSLSFRYLWDVCEHQHSNQHSKDVCEHQQSKDSCTKMLTAHQKVEGRCHKRFSITTSLPLCILCRCRCFGAKHSTLGPNIQLNKHTYPCHLLVLVVNILHQGLGCYHTTPLHSYTEEPTPVNPAFPTENSFKTYSLHPPQQELDIPWSPWESTLCLFLWVQKDLKQHCVQCCIQSCTNTHR